MDSAMVEEAWTVSCFTATGGGYRARRCRFGRGCLARADDDPSSDVGDWLFARVRPRHRCGDDADHRRGRASICLLAKTFLPIESWIGDGFRVPEPLLRPVCVLPHRHGGRF